MFRFLLAAFHILGALSEFKDYEKLGAIADDNSYETALNNGDLLNKTLNSLVPGDVFFVSNKTFTLVGGIMAYNIKDVMFQIDGTLNFTSDRETWPVNANGDVLECMYLENIENVVFTSTGLGTFNGNGRPWWGAIQFLIHQEDRPRLLHIKTSKNIIVENLMFKDSPFWTFWAEDCDGMVIRHSAVDARITDLPTHGLIDMQAFNTDGFDVTGRNVHIHDCYVWNQDDCITVKDGSENMLFERINASGLGLVIGSIGGSRVNNITFRDCILENTFKGIYMKTRWSDSGPVGEAASISNVLYENITINNPVNWGLWMGPAQQTGQPCDIVWPMVEKSECIMSGYQTWTNITLRNIRVNNPKKSPGLLMGNASNPMTNVVFDNVVVTNPAEEPWGDDFYYCEGIEGVATGGTFPVPPCFKEVDN
jgi:polygalacturonase